MELVRRSGNRKIYDVFTVISRGEKIRLGRPVGVYGRVDDLDKEDYPAHRFGLAGYKWAYFIGHDVKVFDTYWEGRKYIERLENQE